MARQFFEGPDGQLSSIRLYSFIALMMAAALTWYDVIRVRNNVDYVVMWLVAAFAPKVVQRFAEKTPVKKD